jgi:hypothetical protein
VLKLPIIVNLRVTYPNNQLLIESGKDFNPADTFIHPSSTEALASYEAKMRGEEKAGS